MINRDLIDIFLEIAREKNIERSELGTIIEELFLFIIDRETADFNILNVLNPDDLIIINSLSAESF